MWDIISPLLQVNTFSEKSEKYTKKVFFYFMLDLIL